MVASSWPPELIDKYPVLIIPYTAFNLPIATWIWRSTILQIPYEVQEAAMVDGASRATVLRRIIWPLLIPAVATTAILSAILCWNEFLFALSLTRSAAKTSPVGVQESPACSEPSGDRCRPPAA
jgi:ABC-type glycerol-3-phosphate transport system permease component